MRQNQPDTLYTKGLALIIAILIVMPGVNAWAGETRKLQVDGLACPFCSYGIEKQLSAISGVKAVKISVKTGTVTVTMNDGATLSQARARQAVNDAGFSLRSFR